MEVLIALSVIILVVTALVRVVTISIRSTDYSRHASMATTYATEALEKIRSFRDVTTWTAFTAIAGSIKFFGTGAYAITNTADYLNSLNCPATVTVDNFSDPNYSSRLIDNIFIRCSKLESIGVAPANYIKATISVYWLENEAVKKAELFSYFYNWK